MREPGPASSSDGRTPFERFRDLARHVLTTPKAELMKHVPKKTTKAKRKGKK